MQSQVAKFQERYARTDGAARAGSRKHEKTIEAQLRLQLHPEEQKEASIVNGGSLTETFESK